MVDLPPLSFSTMTTFQNCPYRYFREKVLKDVKDDIKHPVALWGTRCHKALEEFFAYDTPLPNGLTHLQEYADKLKGIEGDRYIEAKLAVNTMFDPIEFFDNKAMYRGIVDFLVIRDDRAFLIDHKFGKVKSSDQLSLSAVLIFSQFPQVQEIKAAYYWPEVPTYVPETHTPTNARAVEEQRFRPIRQEIIRAAEDDRWPMRPSGLCGYCPVKDCRHNRS